MSMPVVKPTRTQRQGPARTAPENTSPDCCRKHCHYPTVKTGRYSAGSEVVSGCPCMENHVDCDFGWGTNTRGFCKNCHHASSLTVRASDCKLDF